MELHEIYRCAVCGNIVEVVHKGENNLMCDGQKMEKMTENSTDAAEEKHVPVIDKNGQGVKVKIGSVPHPMIPEHHIEWIEAIDQDGKAYKQFLETGTDPEAVFSGIEKEGLVAREYCNLHGLWMSK